LGLQLYGMRLGVAVAALWLLILAFIAASVDGYAYRLVRRYRVGRESADRYNFAKAWVHLGIVGFSVYLMLPVSVDPRLVLFPGIAFAAICTREMFAFYKKYI